MEAFTRVKREIPKEIHFFIGFASKQVELDNLIHNSIPNLVGDTIFWICYPKMSSKKYACEFNRDEGWAEIGKYNMEPVRVVAIDEDWSALRFRKVNYIKDLTRNSKMILSEAGKSRMNKVKRTDAI